MTESLPLAVLAAITALLAVGLLLRLRFFNRNAGSEARFASLTTVAADAIITIDQHSVILSWNRGAEGIFGHDAAAMIGRPLQVLIPERYRAGHEAGVAGLCQGSRIPFSGKTRELYALRSDGSEFPIELTVSSWSGAQGRLFIGIIRDITERRQTDDALRRAKIEAEQGAHAKSEFLAMMSHEIRTPLNGIIGMLQLLRGSTLDARQSDWVETIHYSSHALLTIVDDVLSFSKLESGRLELEQVDFDLWRLGSSITALLASRAAEKGVLLSMHADESVPRHLKGDPTRLRQVLLNLVSNAIKFTEHGSVVMAVTVTSRTATGALLHFSVTDTGIGVSDKAKPCLFQAYAQADASISRRFGGTGLGLAICKKIIDAMAGRIGVDSCLGEGSTFWFEVPFEFSEKIKGAFESPVAPPQTENELPPAHVLIVEDNPINQKVAETLLRAIGIKTDTVGNGRLAVNAVMDGHDAYDAVLMDVEMPEMDGIEATRLIRRQIGTNRLPIIGLTALAREEELRKCRDAGMDDIITKPIDAVILHDTLRRWLSRSTMAVAPPWPAIIDGALPDDLPPFDIAVALKRIDGNRKLLREVIIGFHQHFAGAAADLRRLIQEGNRTEAQRLSHSLRGVAGTVEAVRLFAAANDVETALRDGRTDLALRIDTLEAALLPALASAKALESAGGHPPATGQESGASLDASRPPKDTKILVIDDDPLNIQILHDILGGEHEIVVASDGAKALELARRASPDLILLDIMMPGMNGYEVCSHLKAYPATADIPVIFITSLGDIDAEIRGLEVGAADYVAKPISAPIIRMRIRNQIELKKTRDGLTILAEVDGLTGLINRRRFDEMLEMELRRLRRSKGMLSLILLDVDHFKIFNDTYGHVAGDDCLRQIGYVIRSAASRSSDHSARYGGEEFCIILPDTDYRGATALAERVRSIVAGLRIPHSGSSVADHVTVSLGVLTVKCQPRDSAKSLVAMADVQLYRAKREGRNRIAGEERGD
ncbi:conserved hypothetical protein [Candidatus Terasakiella magnetica]|nr:conserved hypothetical protein [Candidatus Terasakiella magnetica]